MIIKKIIVVLFAALLVVPVFSGASLVYAEEEDDDYDFLGKGRIPVILGAAYKETFSIGDTFEGYYIFDRFTFEVTGFAEKQEIQ